MSYLTLRNVFAESRSLILKDGCLYQLFGEESDPVLRFTLPKELIEINLIIMSLNGRRFSIEGRPNQKVFIAGTAICYRQRLDSDQMLITEKHFGDGHIVRVHGYPKNEGRDNDVDISIYASQFEFRKISSK